VAGASYVRKLAELRGHSGSRQVACYTIASAFASIAEVILVNRLGYTQPTIGSSFTLDSIAPVVVGGTSLFGSVGGVWRTVGGVLVMGTLNNLMVLLGENIYIEQIVEGVIVLAVVYRFIRLRRSTA
jgi:ribose transport system permease protein